MKAGALFRSPAELPAHLLRDQADAIVGIVRQATVRVNAVEDAMLDRGVASNCANSAASGGCSCASSARCARRSAAVLPRGGA